MANIKILGAYAANPRTVPEVTDVVPLGVPGSTEPWGMDLGALASLVESTLPAETSSFGTISVAGQDNVVADKAGNTFTLVEGANITITTDKATDTVTIAASGGGGGLPLQLPIRSGAFYATWYADALADVAPDDIADAIFAVPFVCSEAKTWTRIGFHQVTGVDGTSARMGIHEADPTTGFPGDLLLDAGTISTATANDASDREITISQLIPAATLHWLVFVAENPLIVIKMMAEIDSARAAVTQPGAGFATGYTTSIGRAPLGGYSTTTGYGALPDPFPDFNGMTDTGNMPYIWLRVV